mmetsp:Transcript_25066/g.45143  ORF Transcript_25066/g.45143 Transcript_25066/m.45143 type:complete len:122 (-) Transcript_25066:204-569(-)
MNGDVALIFFSPCFIIGYQPRNKVWPWENWPGQDAVALLYTICLTKKYIKPKVLRMSKTTNSLPKHSCIVAVFTDCLPKVSMSKTAESSANAKNSMGSLPAKNIHYSKDMFPSEEGHKESF